MAIVVSRPESVPAYVFCFEKAITGFCAFHFTFGSATTQITLFCLTSDYESKSEAYWNCMIRGRQQLGLLAKAQGVLLKPSLPMYACDPFINDVLSSATQEQRNKLYE